MWRCTFGLLLMSPGGELGEIKLRQQIEVPAKTITLLYMNEER